MSLREARPRPSRPALLLLAALAVACAAQPPRVAAAVGYTRLSVGGELALDGDAQRVGEAFGLGGERSSPWFRADVDAGVPRVSLSGFWLHEEGDGVLTAPFGGLPAGTPVAADLDLGNAKLLGVLAAGFGPLTVAPGVCVDVFAIDFRAASSPGNREEVDEIVAVPLPAVRLEADAGPVRIAADLAWFDAAVFGVDGRFTDVDARIVWRTGSGLRLEAGYRWLGADAEGESATDAVGIDLTVRGWFVGGGWSF
jgi:hypothetical protein